VEASKINAIKTGLLGAFGLIPSSRPQVCRFSAPATHKTIPFGQGTMSWRREQTVKFSEEAFPYQKGVDTDDAATVVGKQCRRCRLALEVARYFVHGEMCIDKDTRVECSSSCWQQGWTRASKEGHGMVLLVDWSMTQVFVARLKSCNIPVQLVDGKQRAPAGIIG
jgi:hypothetical protein